MDIHKEREAFDKWHYEQYLLENPNIDIANAKYIYDYAHNNALVYQLRESHFTAWQAAKAQAVPEGFVLVEKDLIHSIYQSCIECLDVDIPPIFRATVCTIRDEVEPLIEAQEAT